MNQAVSSPTRQSSAILLFNDECNVCRIIGHWVERSARSTSGEPRLIVRPIGDDPEACRKLNPHLDIWDAYATIHLLMPDGSMKVGGEAVADVLRALPSTRWFAWIFALTVFGARPFQWLLDVAYAILSDVRPLFGCESCGSPSGWWRPIAWLVERGKALFGHGHPAVAHFTRSPLLAKSAHH